MKERSKKAPSSKPKNAEFHIEPGELYLGVKREYVPNSHHNAFSIFKLTEKGGVFNREHIYGPNLIEYVLPNLEMLAKEHLEGLVL